MNYHKYFLNRLSHRISKTEVNEVVDEILEHPDSFGTLVKFMIHGNAQQSNMAAWVLTHTVDREMKILEPFVKDIIDFLEKDISEGVRRSCLRALEKTKITEQYAGKLIDLCFGYFDSKIQPVAIKSISMSIIFNCAQNEPDVLNELKLMIEDQLDYQTAAVVGRGKVLINKINKIIS